MRDQCLKPFSISAKQFQAPHPHQTLLSKRIPHHPKLPACFPSHLPVPCSLISLCQGKTSPCSKQRAPVPFPVGSMSIWRLTKSPSQGHSNMFPDAGSANLGSKRKSWRVFADPHSQHTGSLFVSVIPRDFTGHSTQLAPAARGAWCSDQSNNNTCGCGAPQP